MSFLSRGRTAEELIQAGIAPVKPEHWREGGGRVLVQAITTNAAPAQHKKSKRQQKKDRKEKAGNDLCFNFALGTCEYGEKCKFNHDPTGYIRSRPPELPGTCPNSALPRCPFGITCRWASTHTNPDPLTLEYVITPSLGSTVGQTPADSVSGEPPVVSASAGPTEAGGKLLEVNDAAGPGVTAGQLPKVNGSAGPGEAGGQLVEDLAGGNKQQGSAEEAMLDDAALANSSALAESVAASSAVLADSAVGSSGQAPASVACGETTSMDIDVVPPASTAGTAVDNLTGDARGLNGHIHGAEGAEPGQTPGVSVVNGAALPEQAPGVDEAGGRGMNGGGLEGQGGELNPGASGLKGDGTIPIGTIVLPLQEDMRPATNVMDKAVQSRLRRGEYNFGKSRQVLEGMGVKGGRSGGWGDGEGKARKQAAAQEPSQATPKGGPPVGQGAEKDASPVSPSDNEPALKRMRSGPAPEAGETQPLSAPEAGGTQPLLAAGAGDQQAVLSVPRNGVDLQNGTGNASTPPSADVHQKEDPPVRLYDLAENRAMDVDTPLKPCEKRKIDFRGKLYLAPLTTVGNLPFRRVCKGLGADITCGEMAMATNLLQGQASEWALLKRHPCEDMFGVQVCGGYVDAMTKCAQLLEEQTEVDFVDINFGCPIDCVTKKNAGSACLTRPAKVESIARGMSSVLSAALTIKVRKGYNDGADIVHTWLPRAPTWGVQAAVLHGRTRQQRYTKLADWEYISSTAAACEGLQLIGNGDVMSQAEYYSRLEAAPHLATAMIARAALIKPWIFTEIKERRDWDISAGERLDLLKSFCSAGLTHWGSDLRGVEATRRFLLEWLSFLHRYIPVGLLEVVPQRMSWRPPPFKGRSDLETLLGSDNAADWVRITEMLLGPAPADFSFAPKHKSNAYASTEVSMAHEAEQDQG